jgi:signal transduction histidine kinase/CheY-like chemotaxis protein
MQTASTQWAAADEIHPSDFAGEIARGGVAGVAVLAAGSALLATTIWNPIPAEAFWIVVALSIAAALGWAGLYLGPRAAGSVLTAALGAIVVAGATTAGATWMLPWSSVAVLVGAAVGGWRVGVLAALALTGAVGLAVRAAPEELPIEVLLSTGGLTWSSLFICWLVSRPTTVALGWALHSYHEARERTDEARSRQGELASLSKSLGEYAYRLEQLNLDLAQARRSANEARQLKEQFAAAVSHELRTPLNLILGFCEMMVLTPDDAYGQSLPASYRADLEAMYRNALHISALVDDILDLSQIDAGRMALHREWASPRTIVGEAVATVETLFSNRHLTVRNLVGEDLPTLYVDRTRIRQILINLLSNAARFLQSGGATITGELRGDSLTLAVRDTGPGIPPGDLPYVFEDFRQATAATSGHRGSGLGLAVSRRFAEMHGGEMRVESALGVGTTFYLDLPTSEQAPRNNPGAESWDDRTARRARGQAVRRVAVLAEDEQVRRVFQRHLDHYEVVDGSALATIEGRDRLPLHAVVLGTPDDGARWGGLVEQIPDFRRSLVLTCALRTSQRTADDLGVHACLTKPVSREQLRAALRSLRRPIRRILVVDDNEAMTRLLVRMLRSIRPNVSVEIGNDGTEALTLARDAPPDLILLDLLMPTIDGYEVLERLGADPALRDIPVVLITAQGTHSEKVVAERLTVERPDGLAVGELMAWVKGGLDAVWGPPDTDPAIPAAPRG